jgi:aspartate-semialdehyde dehydrogenase
MSTDPQPLRIAIVGASSLLGKELKEVLEQGSLAASQIRLLDDEMLAGTLTEAGGEPVVIQAVSEESFERIRFAFFAGDPAFTAAHWREAQRVGATVIDLSGGARDAPDAVTWIQAIQKILPARGAPHKNGVILSPSAAVVVACSAVATLALFGLERMAILFLRPVSERGARGIEELESQTVKLLSFQPIAQEVFGTQVAFNLLDRYGLAAGETLGDARAAIARSVERYLAGREIVPAIQLIHAPVFHSTAFSIYAELREKPEPETFARAAAAVGVRIMGEEDDAPSNVSVAGEGQAVFGRMERDPNVARGWWIWGAADNLRLAATNAVQIAENLLAS